MGVVNGAWFGAGVVEGGYDVGFQCEMVVSETCVLTPLCEPTVCVDGRYICMITGGQCVRERGKGWKGRKKTTQREVKVSLSENGAYLLLIRCTLSPSLRVSPHLISVSK